MTFTHRTNDNPWRSRETAAKPETLDTLDTTPRGTLLRLQAIERAERLGLLKFAEPVVEEQVVDPHPRQGIS